MKRNIVQIAFIMTMVAMLVFGMVSLATAASNTWYLSNDDGEDTIKVKVMYRDDTSKPSELHEMTEDCSQGPSGAWIPDEPAVVATTFPAGDWKMHITCDPAPSTDNCFNVSLMYLLKPADQIPAVPVQGVDFDRAPGTTDLVFCGNGNQTVFEGNFESDSFTFPAGAYHWVMVLNCGQEREDSVVIAVGGDSSYIESPVDSPTWPVPEISTIILMSIGLLGLGGFVWFKRHRKVTPDADS